MRGVIVIIIIGIIIIGVIERTISVMRFNDRLKYTFEYREKFIEFCNDVVSTGKMAHPNYSFLVKDINKIQNELGLDGIISVYRDPLAGIQMSNYPIFLNFFNELRVEMNGLGFFDDRINLLIGGADGALLKHIGALEEYIRIEKRAIKNPLYCFSKGISFIISMPIKVLEWCGIFDSTYSNKVISSKIYRAIEKIATIISLVGSIITILMGWEWLAEFCRVLFE